MASHIEVMDTSTMATSRDVTLRYRTRVQTWLVFWLLRLLLGANWSDEVTHILDYRRNGRAIHFFPLNASGYQWLVRLTRIKQEATHA